MLVNSEKNILHNTSVSFFFKKKSLILFLYLLILTAGLTVNILHLYICPLQVVNLFYLPASYEI